MHDEGHPFVVTTDLGNVRVYGTQFNVRRYVDEEGIRATLVDGSVGFAKNGQKEDEYVKILSKTNPCMNFIFQQH